MSVNKGFQVLFHSPPGVLFTFPSQYCALSVAKEYLGLGGGPPGFKQGFSCPALLWILLCKLKFRLPGFHRLRLAFPKPFGYPNLITSAVLNPNETEVLLVWPVPISLAATLGIDFSFSSCRYLDVSVHGVSPRMAMYSPYGDWAFPSRVSPFGHPRVGDCVRLTAAFRSFLRPSSALGAKAFTLCSF